MYTVSDPAVHGNSSVTLQPAAASRVHKDKLLQTAGIVNIRPNIKEQPVLLSGTTSATPTYITLSPASATWPDTQVTLPAPNYSFAITPNNQPAPHVQSQYVIQPPLARIHGHQDEITLNQLNTVPSLSMTLTQLNAGPTMARLNTNVPPSGAILSNARLQQTHYLPVVAMDTVLGHQSERRMSNATTDSAPSDEESKSADDRPLHRIIQVSRNSLEYE